MSASTPASSQSGLVEPTKKKNGRRVLGIAVLGLAVAGLGLGASGAYYSSNVDLHAKVATADWGFLVNGSATPTAVLDIEGIAPGVAGSDSFTVTNTSHSLDQVISVTGLKNLAATGGAGLGLSDASKVLVKVDGTNGFHTNGFVPVTSLANGPLQLGTAVHNTTTTFYVEVQIDASVVNTAFAGGSATFDLTVNAAQKH